jgi:hypothetical protein
VRALALLTVLLTACDDGSCPDVPDATAAQVRAEAAQHPRQSLQGRLQQPDGGVPAPCEVAR